MNATDVYQQVANISGGRNASGMMFSSPMDKTINILTVVVLFITMISLGCTMEILKIKDHLFSPKGVGIAMVSQFGIMPLTAFCLAKVLKMNNIQAVTLLVCGCCPGGTLSNIFSLALQGDMNLSILLTTCSSFAAMVLMPLLLFIYCQGFPGMEKAVPFVGIMTTLVLTLVPCSMGILLKHYRPKYTPIVMKVGLSVLGISTIIIIVLSLMVIKGLMAAFTPENITAAAIMPLIGYILGYVLSLLCGLNAQCRRTISMETGCQNIQLCFAILRVAFPFKVIGPMFFFPLMYMGFQTLEALLLSLGLRCYQKLNAPAEGEIYSNVKVKSEEMKPQC